jgi:hypothetical protein
MLFPDDVVLAAIAVAVEPLPTPEVERFLEDLARVRLKEIPFAPRVARLALAERDTWVTPFTARTRRIADLPPPRVPEYVEAQPEYIEIGTDYQPYAIPA